MKNSLERTVPNVGGGFPTPFHFGLPVSRFSLSPFDFRLSPCIIVT